MRLLALHKLSSRFWLCEGDRVANVLDGECYPSPFLHTCLNGWFSVHATCVCSAGDGQDGLLASLTAPRLLP